MSFITPMYVPMVAISTLCAIVFIGIGFLRAPSRYGALWSVALLSAVVASYGWAAADRLEVSELRAASTGLLLSALALVWSGVRAYAERPQRLAYSLAWMGIAPAALLLASFFGSYDLVFRLVFLVTSVFAALTIVELVRMRPLVRDEVLPLLTMSAIFLIFTVIVLLEGLIVRSQGPALEGASTLQFVITIRTVSTVVYMVGTTITMLLLTREGRPVAPDTRSADFDKVAAARLKRAAAAQDPWWSLVDIRLDNPDEIRAMSGSNVFAAISDRLEADINRVLPPDADVERVSPVRFVALVPRAQSGMRTLLANLLECVARVGPEQPSPIRLTVSIGWAQVTAVGYDLHDLSAAAAQAAEDAYEEGGDRWERVRATA